MTDAHIIIAGDSLALGYLNTGPAPYTPTVRVQIWVDGQWVYMNPGVNTGTPNNPTAWGYEVQIANRWLQGHEDGFLWVVKGPHTVKGGTTLAHDWDPSTGSYFASTTATADAARHNLDNTVFQFDHYDAAFISLGTNDAAQGLADGYLDRLVDFNMAARAQWRVDELVEGRIGDVAGNAADNLSIRQAQWWADQLDDALVTVRAIGIETRPDGVHIADYVTLGDQLYEGWVL